MSNHESGDAEVHQAFRAWQARLASRGFSQTWQVYYRLGDYELGPQVTLDQHNIKLVRDPHLRWRFTYDNPAEDQQLPGLPGFWRLHFFGFDGVPGGFATNGEAVTWFEANN